MLQERAKYQATDSRVHEQIIALNESKLSLQNEIQSLELEIASIGRDIDLTTKKHPRSRARRDELYIKERVSSKGICYSR